MNLCPWTVFGAKPRPRRLQDASRNFPTFGAFLAENGPPLGHIVAQNRSSIDRRLEPPTITSGKGFGKT